ncbi:hypothetical protein QQP08_027088 [Theobroma cacao]|nr:hypothetical protein QQP08_027088 [Theobroma cacao]
MPFSIAAKAPIAMIRRRGIMRGRRRRLGWPDPYPRECRLRSNQFPSKPCTRRRARELPSHEQFRWRIRGG